MVYDITNPKSFEQLDSWREEFLHQVTKWTTGYRLLVGMEVMPATGRGIYVTSYVRKVLRTC